ncbi:MAG: TlpA family protein disulfide reductase [Anaerolineales bacterium]|nr:TlpA family protein disulfide reductase [Anaerolineales bacterium]
MKHRLAGLFALLALAACAAPAFSGPAPEVGARAPDFALQNLQGETVRLSQLRGEVVLINFWATWCGPCRLEMPAIQARYNHGGFTVLAVDFAEPADLVQAFVDELGLSFPILLDPAGEVQEIYRVRGYPSTFFVDPQGFIRHFHIGEMSEQILDNYLAEMGVLP